jgi:adenosylmethionine-8-amino-7-oxononanoate aminotransferase
VVHDTVVRGGGFTHGFTYSHTPGGATAAREVLRILEEEQLVDASRDKGQRLTDLLHERLAPHPNLGDIRGRGLMVGLELVADRETRAAFPRAARVTERIVRAARDRGVLVYSATGNANGVDGDTILLGPPFVVTDTELERIAETVATAVDEGTRDIEATSGSAARPAS